MVGLSCLLQRRVLEFLSESARIVSLLLGTTRHVSSRRTAEECCLQLKRKVRRVVFFRVAGGLIQLRGKGRLFLLVWPCHPPPSPGSWSIVRDRVWKAFFHWRLASHAHTSPVPPPRCTSTRPRDGCNALQYIQPLLTDVISTIGKSWQPSVFSQFLRASRATDSTSPLSRGGQHCSGPIFKEWNVHVQTHVFTSGSGIDVFVFVRERLVRLSGIL